MKSVTVRTFNLTILLFMQTNSESLLCENLTIFDMLYHSHCFPLILENVNGLALKAAGTHVIHVAIDENTILSVHHIFHMSNLSVSFFLSGRNFVFLKTSMMTDGEFHKTCRDQLMFHTKYQCFLQLTIKIFLVL